MWTAFLWCWVAGFVVTIVYNLTSSKALNTVLRSVQERHFGGLVFYFVMTSLTYGVLFFGVFFIANLVFEWV